MFTICNNHDHHDGDCEARPDIYRIVRPDSRRTVGLVVPFPGHMPSFKWDDIIHLIDAAPDLRKALGDLLHAYADEIGVPAEACDKGVMARAWAAIRKAEGVA